MPHLESLEHLQYTLTLCSCWWWASLLESCIDPSLPHPLACRKAKAVELMLVDALLAADRVLHLSERIMDPRKFVRLDDTLLRSIENYELFHGDLSDCDDDRAIHEAQAVIARCARNFVARPCDLVRRI